MAATGGVYIDVTGYRLVRPPEDAKDYVVSASLPLQLPPGSRASRYARAVPRAGCPPRQQTLAGVRVGGEGGRGCTGAVRVRTRGVGAFARARAHYGAAIQPPARPRVGLFPRRALAGWLCHLMLSL